ncbi:MAG: hypothetical protein ACPGU7_06335 [Gammaproteobacteria bacterium]
MYQRSRPARWTPWALAVFATLATLVVALLILRALAPGLIGLSPDLTLVQAAEERAPFYANVFRVDDFKPGPFLVPDPLTHMRARPLDQDRGGMGPHDILGFRNRAVGNVADVVVIGDSQTYGNNVTLEQNWPSVMAGRLAPGRPVYAMATGGWGAVQYYQMALNAGLFRPRVMIMAFYTGNDPLDSARLAFADDRWTALRPPGADDAVEFPKVNYPAPPEEQWPVVFANGLETVFSPQLRLVSNAPGEAADAGYAIMERVAREIATQTRKVGIDFVVTLIPTKEYAFARRVAVEKLDAPAAYQALVDAEGERIRAFAEAMERHGVRYVDVVGPMQQAASEATRSGRLYPGNVNGHPSIKGYSTLGNVMAEAVEPLLPPLPTGVVVARLPNDQSFLFRVQGGDVWRVFPARAQAAGWPLDRVVEVQERDLLGLNWRGMWPFDASVGERAVSAAPETPESRSAR